jgi:hypothetical protein
MPSYDRVGGASERSHDAEVVLKKLGFSRVPAARRDPAIEPTFWVQESGVPRRTFPVYVPPADHVTLGDRIDRWVAGARGDRSRNHRAIFVVPNDDDAEDAWARLGPATETAIDHEVSILVVPASGKASEAPHFHLRVTEPKEVLRIATGVVVGLFRRSAEDEGSSQIDFEELLALLRQRFGIDVQRSLGVRSDEDALFVLYQLAARDSYAPGDSGSNLHLLVLKPTGPAARLPWFAA